MSILGENIRKRRLELDYSQEQLAKLVGYASRSSINKIELGQTDISQKKIIAFAKALNTTPTCLMGYNEKVEAKLTDIALAKGRIDELKKIDDCLNKAGHTQFVRYGAFLASQDEYKQSGEHYEAPMETIRDYQTPCAAGYAAPIQGEDYIDVPRDISTPREADFSVHVAGDSMEPFIKDGQRVFVKRDCNLEEGDVGIFYYDGQVFIKQFCPSYDGSVYLLSANPKREDANKIIDRDANSTLICFGKVILPHRLPMPAYD